MKDNFSRQSNDYAKYRPTYPSDLLEYLYTLVPDYNTAWDCATGNGQIAAFLADKFQTVFATDISQNQLDNALYKDNIFYSCSPAEHTEMNDNSLNLITVGQAIHWFNFDLFYQEVNRTLKKEAGVLAVIGYGLNTVNEEVDAVTKWFYKDIVGQYWDKERHYIEEEYKTIPFPFKELYAPSFNSLFQWTLTEYLGYLSTWSAVQHFLKATGEDPVKSVADKLSTIWPENEKRTVCFPILLRVGKIQ